MAESTGNKGLGQPPEQMSTETRLLLAFLLMGAIMFLTPYFFKSQAAPAQRQEIHAGRRSRRATVPPTAAESKVPGGRRSPAPPTAPVIQAPGAAAPGHQYRPLQDHLQQSGRQRAELAAEEVAGRRQAAGTGEYRGDGRRSVSFRSCTSPNTRISPRN
jgi:hypothetical protein